MATVSVTIPDPVLARVLDAFATAYGYNPATDGTKAAFAKRQVARFVMETVRAHEATTAANAALKAATDKATTEITIS